MADDHRILSKPNLQFTVECGVNNRRGVASGYGGRKNLAIIGRMMAGEAARTSGWDLPSYRPIYVIVTVNLRITRTNNTEANEWRKKLVANKMIPVRTPSTNRIDDIVTRMLVGPIIKDASQICAITIVKKLSKDRDFIEIFVGAPVDWSELNHDIRNG